MSAPGSVRWNKHRELVAWGLRFIADVAQAAAPNTVRKVDEWHERERAEMKKRGRK